MYWIFDKPHQKYSSHFLYSYIKQNIMKIHMNKAFLLFCSVASSAEPKLLFSASFPPILLWPSSLHLLSSGLRCSPKGFGVSVAALSEVTGIPENDSVQCLQSI